MSRLARNIAANLLGNGWSTLLSLALTPLYVRLLGLESYGLIGFYTSWLAILGILDNGISATAAQEVAWMSARPDERGRIPSLVRSLEAAYWAIVAVLGAVLFLAAWVVGAAWFQPAGMPAGAVRTAMMLMVCAMVVQMPSGLYLAGLTGLQRQVQSSALLALFGTIRGAGAVAVLILFDADIRGFFVWQIAASAAQTLTVRAALLMAIDGRGHPARFSRDLLASVRPFAGGMALVTTLGVIVTQVDKLILSRAGTLQAFGVYMLAWTVASGLSRVAAPLLQAFSPHFTDLASRGEVDTLGSQLRIANQLMSALILPPAALLVFAAEPILLAWLMDPAVVAGVVAPLGWLVVGSALSACSYPSLNVLYSTKRVRPVVLVNAALVAVLVIGLPFTVRAWGPTGAALGWALYGLVTYVVYNALVAQRLPGRAAARVLRDFGVPAAVSLLAAAVAFQASRQAGNLPQSLAVVAASLAAGWGAAFLVCRDLPALAIRLLHSVGILTRVLPERTNTAGR